MKDKDDTLKLLIRQTHLYKYYVHCCGHEPILTQSKIRGFTCLDDDKKYVDKLFSDNPYVCFGRSFFPLTPLGRFILGKKDKKFEGRYKHFPFASYAFVSKAFMHHF
jgi:hypothetical protein